MQIVAATDFSTRSHRAVRPAGLLARPAAAHLHVVHVVDDDQPDDLIRMEKREAERVLSEQLASMPELQEVQVHPKIITGDPFDGILRAATEASADLIVMGSHRKQLLLDIFIGTTIERVIRKGSFPVLMVNNEAQHKYENVLVPVDLSNVSAHALRVAQSTGLVIGEQATLLYAFIAPARGKMFMAGYDKSRVDSYIASERRLAGEEVAAYLSTNTLGSGWSLRLEEGTPMAVISRAISEMRPDLLVMGTHGRSALTKALIGSVTEEALRSLSVDILAVPPAK
jgi:nucleotide-binding universal stress UspA family protein